MPPWTLCGHSPAIALAQHCKTLHLVKPAILAQEPRLAWAGHLIAPPPGFAQFSNAKPVGGRGISDFSCTFFSFVPVFETRLLKGSDSDYGKTMADCRGLLIRQCERRRRTGQRSGRVGHALLVTIHR